MILFNTSTLKRKQLALGKNIAAKLKFYHELDWTSVSINDNSYSLWKLFFDQIL